MHISDYTIQLHLHGIECSGAKPLIVGHLGSNNNCATGLVLMGCLFMMNMHNRSGITRQESPMDASTDVSHEVPVTEMIA